MGDGRIGQTKVGTGCLGPPPLILLIFYPVTASVRVQPRRSYHTGLTHARHRPEFSLYAKFFRPTIQQPLVQSYLHLADGETEARKQSSSLPPDPPVITKAQTGCRLCDFTTWGLNHNQIACPQGSSGLSTERKVGGTHWASQPAC